MEMFPMYRYFCMVIYARLQVGILGVNLVTFSCFGPLSLQYGFQGCFFSDLGVEFNPESSAQMC